MLVKRHATLLLIAALLGSEQYIANHVWPPQVVRAAPSSPDVTDRPDPVSAQLTARLEGHRVHIQDFDNASDTTYANPNGTFTTEISSGPIRTPGPNGWVPIDTHLVADRGVYRPAAADSGATISSGGSGDIASATSGSAQVGIGFGSALPTPTVSGATAVYTHALPGVNVVASATEGGFDIQLILTSRPTGPLTFNMPLHATGVTVVQDSSGALRYRDAAGNEIFTTSAPLMYGAETDPHSGVPTRSESVTSSLVSGPKGPVLQITPDPSFLADPSVAYPVTIDPSTNINRSNYGFDENGGGNFYNNTINEDGVTGILRVGTFDGGTYKNRGFYSFSNATFAGKYVTAATLVAYEHWSYSCTAREVDIYDLSTNYTTSSTWTNPPTELGKVASATVAKGYSSSCPAGNVSFTVTSLAQRWAGLSSGLHSLELRAASETDSYGWKEFSGNSSTSMATLSVTYDSYPNTPTNPLTGGSSTCTASPGVYLSTTTPTLSAIVSDPDGGSLQGAFELWQNTTEIGAQNLSASVTSGSTASWTVPSGTLSNGVTYYWRARGWDGVQYSKSYSPSCYFSIDTTVDAAPIVSSSTYPQNAWSASGTASNNFGWSDTSGGDANGWQFQEDLGGWSTTQPLTPATLTWNPTTVAMHELDVRAVNKAGLPGNAAQYFFGIGQGSLVTPADQDRTQASVALSANAPTTYPWAAYFWRQGTSAALTSIPTGDVTIPGTTTNPTWPVASDGSGNFTPLNWNLANTVRSAGQSDGDVQVEACYYLTQTQSLSSPSVCAPVHNVQLASHAFGATYATASAGPGSVSLLTGDFEIATSDGSVPTATATLSVGRSITTADPTGELRNLLPSNLHDAEPPLTGWSAPFQATTATVTSPTVLGANSLQLAPYSGSCTVCNETYVAVGGDSGALRLGLQPGRTYTFTSREYVPSGTGLTTDNAARGERPVFMYQIGTSGYHEFDGTAPSATNTWQLVYLTFTVPDGATEAFIRLYNGFNVGKTGSAVYYDDLTLVRDSVYGAGWQADLPGPPAGDADLTISDYTSLGYVVLTAPDGGESVFTVSGSSACCPIAYSGLNDANDGTVLTKTAANTFTMTDPDGTVTTWQSSDGGATWVVQSVVEPGSSTQTTYGFDPDGRVTQVVGPAPLGVTCSAPLTTAGCRTLTLTYASTTAAPPTGSSWGDYPGLLKAVSFTAADPTNGNAMTTVAIASFTYDSNGFLRQAWDPRLSTQLKATYGYGSDMRIISVTPPGLNAWSLTYDSSGRLSQVSRPDPAGGTDTTTFVYNVRFTGTGAPIEMGGATTSTWNQATDLPNYGAAEFGPDHPMPAGTTASSVTAADWPYAVIHYLDVNGREVNAASYGAGAWQITTTGYDQWGNVLTQVGALARDEAISPASYPDLDAYVAGVSTSAGRAALLSTINTYSTDGTELLDTLGPMHPVLLTTGSTVDARSHTHTTYDEGAPGTGGPYRLPTTVTTAAQTVDGVDDDILTAHKAYDPIITGDTSGWTLRQPTSQTTVMGGGTANLVLITRYDAQGRVIETRMPANTAGGDAHSTLSTYYSATGIGSCVNVAEAGLLCQTAPAAQPTSGPNLLTTTTTYNMWGARLTVTETNGTGTRTTTTLYDPAQRECVHSITTSGVGDTALPAVYTAYDPNTGLVTQTGNISGSTPTSCPSSPPTMSSWISTIYDSDGRTSTYTDASNNLSSVTYTADGLTATFYDGKASVTYTYDGVSGEHRRLLTSLVDSQAGTFSATYDANGALTSQTYPSGLLATRHYDDVGQTRSLAYVMGSTTWLSFGASYSAHGQILAQSSNGSSQLFTYDNAGRLTQVADTDQTVNPVACTTRVYAYDADTNRPNLTSYPGSSPGVCSTSTTPTVTSHTYDQADRISNSGYAYDPLGRTTTVPAADAGGTNALTVGYYVNDMVASQVQGTSSKSFALDPTERLTTITTGASVQTNRYADGSDSPAWISMSDASWTRNVQDIGGNLAAIVSATSDELQLTNLHGDVVATAPNLSNAAGIDAYFESTEFGVTRTSNTTSPRYAWLGGKRRDSGDALAGIVLMGQRLYSPTLGRFLQTDPVPGGSANAYDYVNQDPINAFDLQGTFGWPGFPWLFAKRRDLNNPGGPTLSGAEKAAMRKKWDGLPLTREERRLVSDAERKLDTGEKFRQERNRQKRESNRFSLHFPDWGAPVIFGGGALVTIWWIGKLASPACLPLAFACALIF